MKEIETCFVVKDDFDQQTVCVVQCRDETEAQITVSELFGDVIEGDLYYIKTSLLILGDTK